MPNPFAHIELQTDDVAQAKEFYGAVFGWKLTDMKDQSYTMIEVGKGTGGGMMKKPMPEAPNTWIPYVEVDSVKASVEKARKAGANVFVEYMPIGGMGAIGVFGDPSGAMLGVWEVEKKAAPRKAPAKKAPARKAPAKKKASKKKAAKKAPAKKKASKKRG